MKRALVLIVLLAGASLGFLSCSGGSYGSSGSTSAPSKLNFRAFVSNPLYPSGAGTFFPVLNIINATLDQISFSTVSMTAVSAAPGPMYLSPGKKLLLVVSTSDNSIAVVDTSTESQASTSGTSIPSVAMPDVVTSIAIGPDNATAFAAVPAAPVTGGSPGAIEMLNITNGTIKATLPVPGTRFVAASQDGNRVLATRSDDCVTLIAPSAVGTNTEPRTSICGFDKPVWAVFGSDNTTAYVLNCGPECGGTASSVVKVDLNTDTIAQTVPLNGAGARVGMLSGTTLYVAGSPPGLACGSTTAAPTCGTLTTVDVGSMTASTAAPTIVTDGVHDRIELAANNKIFLGATTCSNVNNGTETRGCLSIVDTSTGAVDFPASAGDVTGIAPITNRNVVYVCQNGNFTIYDTTNDQVFIPTTPPATGRFTTTFVGRAVDVKLVD